MFSGATEYSKVFMICSIILMFFNLLGCKSTAFAPCDEESVSRGAKNVTKPLFGGKIAVF